MLQGRVSGLGLGRRSVSKTPCLDTIRGYQGLRDFRGRGNLSLIVETLRVRRFAPAPGWRFNLWSAAVCLFHFSSRSQLRSLCFPGVSSRPRPSVRRRKRHHPTLGKVTVGIVLISLIGVFIRKMICAGTGTSAGAPCLRDNRPRSCVFALTSGKWSCGRRSLRHTLSRHPHPSGAWRGHPPERGRTRTPERTPALLPSGCRSVRLPSPRMRPETGCRITTGSRGGLLRC